MKPRRCLNKEGTSIRVLNLRRVQATRNACVGDPSQLQQGTRSQERCTPHNLARRRRGIAEITASQYYCLGNRLLMQ